VLPNSFESDSFLLVVEGLSKIRLDCECLPLRLNDEKCCCFSIVVDAKQMYSVVSNGYSTFDR
jgi:hypothetical protein